MLTKIPKEIKTISKKLVQNGYSAYLVGGCVRDIILGGKPKDWDIATDATPEKIQEIFPDSFYENDFGTVGVKTKAKDETLSVVEVTTFRTEGEYKDKRRPESVSFVSSIEEDLKRRDFTINAIAISLNSKDKNKIIDPYGGQEDIKNKLIRSVLNPYARFAEDALRLMRAIRLAVQLNFSIEEETFKAIKEKSHLLDFIAKERIRDEFIKIIMSENAANGIIYLEDANLLRYIVPELREGIGCAQNKHHIYTVFEHNVRSLDYAAKKGCSLEIRLAALFHDIAKPRVKKGEGENSTFYNHEILGAKMTEKALNRLHFNKELVSKVSHLVKHHLFYYNVGEVTEGGVRRFLSRVGVENVEDLLKLREADRIGSGVPKAFPYKLRHLKYMIDKVKRDPLSSKMLKINGNDVMEILNIRPGPKVGWILEILLDEVLDDPSKNNKDYLSKEVKRLGLMPDNDLLKKAKEARLKKDELESELDLKIRKKHNIK